MTFRAPASRPFETDVVHRAALVRASSVAGVARAASATSVPVLERGVRSALEAGAPSHRRPMKPFHLVRPALHVREILAAFDDLFEHICGADHG